MLSSRIASYEQLFPASSFSWPEKNAIAIDQQLRTYPWDAQALKFSKGKIGGLLLSEREFSLSSEDKDFFFMETMSFCQCSLQESYVQMLLLLRRTDFPHMYTLLTLYNAEDGQSRHQDTSYYRQWSGSVRWSSEKRGVSIYPRPLSLHKPPLLT
ncbi:hypothetical protein EON64_13325, partial [archaeon]